VDKTNEDDSMEEDLKILNNLPQDGWDEDKSFWPIINFIGKYVAKLYGKRKIQQWSEINKGKSFLCMITTSDIAYCLTVTVNNYEVWNQWFAIKDLGKEELDKYKVKSQSKMTNEEKATYLKKAPKFTKKREKKTYLEHGFSKSGVAFYNEKWKMWRQFFMDKGKRDKLEICWEEYVRVTGFGRQWKSSSDVEDNYDDVEEEVDETMPINHFAMPGDDDFEGDCPWNGVQDDIMEEDNEEEIGMVEAAAGNKGMGDRKYTHKEVEKAGQMLRESSSDEGSSEEDDIDFVGTKKSNRVSLSPDDSGSDIEEDDTPVPKKKRKLPVKKKRQPVE
jgi:hypothetical protein